MTVEENGEYVQKTTTVDKLEVVRDPSLIQRYQSTLDQVPMIIHLKVGAQVMLTYNLSVEEGLVNGSRGVIAEIHEEENVVMVTFRNQPEPIKITRHSWEHVDKDAKMIYSRNQIPLVLAYALTTHKSQSCSLDLVIVDLGPKVFLPSMAYVALSRVRSIDGLFISNISPKSIRADQDALAFIEEVEGIK